MRTFLAGIGGQYVMRRRQNKLSDWDRAWTGGRKEGIDEGLEKGLGAGASDVLTEYLEFKFGKTKPEIVPFLENIPLDEIKALMRFACTCDNYESFIQRTKEAKHYCQPS